MISHDRFARFSHGSVVSLVCALILTSQAWGQAGFRESLERLDKNENGEIEPQEITPLARPFLERITQAARMSVDRNNRIEDLQEAARRYHALQNGASGKDVRPAGESTVKPFGADQDEPIVPEFGLVEVKYPYTQDDLDFADRTMSSHDHDKDGYIDREEAKHEKWTHRNPFDDDLDKDDRLSRLELAQRYARRRLLDRASGELMKKHWRTGGEVRRSPQQVQRRDDSQWWRQGGNSRWLSASILGRFDVNKNGRLESQESQALGLPTAQIDVDRDGDLSREELHSFLMDLQEETGGLSEGIPGWFYELDTNKDGQISIPEFAVELTAARIQEFEMLDANADGLLTATEMTQSSAMVGGSYHNRRAEVLPPYKTIISEIDVTDDFLIGDLNVQLSVTHTHTSYLDAYLTGPDGQRIELFAGVGGHDDNFDQTILDDQSQFPIVRARPPFKGTFSPGALAKRQPSLGHFNGKSIKGVWQLVIRGTRSDRFGMLHSWRLLVKPLDTMLDQPAAPVNDGPQAAAVSASWPAAKPPETPRVETAKRIEVQRWSEPSNRPTIDYAAIGRKMQEAVKRGEMTQEQVREAWVKIKSQAKGKEDDKESRKEWDRGDKRKLERKDDKGRG